jgi:hypothetical protein
MRAISATTLLVVLLAIVGNVHALPKGNDNGAVSRTDVDDSGVDMSSVTDSISDSFDDTNVADSSVVTVVLTPSSDELTSNNSLEPPTTTTTSLPS